MPAAGNFLFVTWAGGGNVSPLLTLGLQLLARGHRVRVLGPTSLASRFAAAGLEFGTHRDQPDLRGLADDVIAAIGGAATDVAVVDFMQPQALCATEVAKVPTVAFVHTLYQRVARADTSPMRMYGKVDQMNQLRADLGLGVVDRLPDLLDRAARVVVVTAEELDQPVAPLSANVRYVGPLVEPAGQDAEWQPPPPADRPLVHICMGTVASADMARPIIQRALDALEAEPVRVHVATCDKDNATWDGAFLDTTTLSVPANATVSGYVRHAAVFPHVSAFVTHAGLSSIGVALSFGVPMVCTPITNEQPQNAAAVAAAGAGLALEPTASADELRSAITEVLRKPAYRANAKAIARSIADRNAAAVEALEELLP